MNLFCLSSFFLLQIRPCCCSAHISAIHTHTVWRLCLCWVLQTELNLDCAVIEQYVHSRRGKWLWKVRPGSVHSREHWQKAIKLLWFNQVSRSGRLCLCCCCCFLFIEHSARCLHRWLLIYIVIVSATYHQFKIPQAYICDLVIHLSDCVFTATIAAPQVCIEQHF